MCNSIFWLIRNKLNIPVRFKKAGRVWCGGARKTHCATCHTEVTRSKTKDFLESPRFWSLDGSLFNSKKFIFSVIIPADIDKLVKFAERLHCKQSSEG